MKIFFQSYTQTPSFCGLKYKNGIKTKDALSPAVKDLLNKYSNDLAKMKNVDVMVVGSDEFKLCIKNPRFLDVKYERFYKDKEYEINKDENGSSIELNKAPYRKENYNSPGVYNLFYKIMNKLTQSAEPGVYDVACGYRNPGSGNYEWKPALPVRTIEVAKLIDCVMQKIEDAENSYGMNCVNVLDNADEIGRQQYRLNIINQIKQTYGTNGDFSEIDTKDLETLLRFKDKVSGFKYYGINIDEKHWSHPVYIHNNKYYLDEIFNDYYNEFGLEIIRQSNGFVVKSPEQNYPYYNLKDMGGNNYNLYNNFYDGGTNLSGLDISSFEELVKLTEALDNVAEFIDSSISS